MASDLLVRIPLLYGGISRQADHFRGLEMVENAVNCTFSVVSGVSKRAGTNHNILVSGLSASGNYRLHRIIEDEDNQYNIIYGDSTVKAYTESGAAIPVVISSNAQTYIDSNNATANELRLVNIEDYTLIVNTTVATSGGTSSDYSDITSYTDYDIMASNNPTNDTYHRTAADTADVTAGYWQYNKGDGEFANLLSYEMSTYWDAPSDRWNDIAFNPAGFEVTFTDNDSDDHVYEVKWDFYRNSKLTMDEIALGIQQAMRDAGAEESLCTYEVSSSAHYFRITSPYKGSNTNISLDTPVAGVYDMTESGAPFQNGGSTYTVTVGTGTPASDTMPIVDRWTRIAPPNQTDAVITATTMPVKMEKASGSYYTETIIADSPYAYYRLGEASGTTAVNEIVTCGDGTYVNTPTLGADGAIAGDTDTAVTFDGTVAAGLRQSVNCGTMASLGSGLDDITIEAWFKTSTTDAIQTIVSSVSSGGSDTSVLITLNTTTNYAVETGKWRFFVRDDDNTYTTAKINSNTGVTDGQWHHLVAMYNNVDDEWTVYIDNDRQIVSQSSQGSPDNFSNFVDDFFIGVTLDPTYVLPFDGTIDEVAIYLSELTPAQIKTHYDYGIASVYFNIDTNEWKFRETGDNETNPLPSIIKDGKTISDITAHRNRLVITGNADIVFSEAGEPFNFYIKDAGNIVDSDPIDIPFTANEVTSADFIVPFRKSIVIFSKAGEQFELSSPEALTISTAAITPSTTYTTKEVRPQTIGNMLYFAGVTQDGTSTLYEYYYDDSRVANEAANIALHCNGLLPDDIKTITTGSNNNIVMLLENDSNDIYVYTSYWNGNEKIQSAWTHFEFDSGYRICDIVFVRNKYYMLIERDSQYIIESAVIAEEYPDTGWTFSPRLDSKHTLTGVYSSPNTTWTLPINDESVDTIVLGPDFGDDAYSSLTPDSVSGSTVTIAGDYSAGECIIGRSYSASVQLSRPYLKDYQGNSIMNASLYMNRIVLHYENTSDFSVRVSITGFDDQTSVFTTGDNSLDTGEHIAWLTGKIDDTTEIYIENNSYTPSTITSVEILGQRIKGIV